MGLTFIEIKTEIWISISSFINSGRVLPQEKYSTMALLLGWSLKPSKEFSYVMLAVNKPFYQRMFTDGPGNLGSIPGSVIPKTFKMVFDTSFFNTQQYKVRMKGKVEQSKEKSSALPYTTV